MYFFLMIRRPPRSTLFPYTSSSDLCSRSWSPCPPDGFQIKEEMMKRQFAFIACLAALLAWLPAQAQELKFATQNPDRKSTRLNSSHDQISYAVFCLKKYNTDTMDDI